MIGEIDVCDRCGRRPSRLAIIGDGSHWRVRCDCGTRLEWMVGDSTEVGEPAPVPTAAEASTLEYVRRILKGATPIVGTPGEKYFRSRRIKVVPGVLRFARRRRHTESNSYFPAIIAPIVDVNGELIGMHTTFIDPTGEGKARVSPDRKMLGRAKGGSVHLGDAGAELGVGEGIESCLSAMQLTGIPTWAALSTSGLAALVLPPPPIARHVTILADNDPAGLAAAREAATRWYSEGRRVSILRPREQGADFNDLLRQGALA